MSRYRRVRVVGKGSFGCCWLVVSDSGDQCILKEIDVSKMPAKQKEEAANEVKVLSKLRHPFIINYRESYMNAGLLCIVTDYAEKGDLYRVIHRQRRSGQLLAEAHVLRWFTQTALALKHLHDRHILHRDLKTQNIFLSGSGCGAVKLGDFGIARVLQHTQDCAQTAIGTPYYLSPEICQEKPYDRKSDVWSLGCVLYELATLQHAFDADSMRGLVMKILKGMPPQLPHSYSAALRALVPEMLTKDPLHRPSIDDVLRRPVMRTMIKQLLQEVEANLRVRPRTEEQPQAADEARNKPRRREETSPAVPQPATPGSQPRRQGAVDAGAPLSGKRASAEHERHRSVPAQSRQQQQRAPQGPPDWELPRSALAHREPENRPQRKSSQLVPPTGRAEGHVRASKEQVRVTAQRSASRPGERTELKPPLVHRSKEPAQEPQQQEQPPSTAQQPGVGPPLLSAGTPNGSQQKQQAVEGGDAPVPSAQKASAAGGAGGSERREAEPTGEPGTRGTDEDLELISTLREGLQLQSLVNGREEQETAASPSAEVTLPPRPQFLSPDGQTLALPVGELDTLSYRVEALKVYLEQEIGLKDFLCMYRFLNDSAQHERSPTAFLDARSGTHLESQVSAKAITFLPLVHQLIVCEDKCFGN